MALRVVGELRAELAEPADGGLHEVGGVAHGGAGGSGGCHRRAQADWAEPGERPKLFRRHGRERHELRERLARPKDVRERIAATTRRPRARLPSDGARRGQAHGQRARAEAAPRRQMLLAYRCAPSATSSGRSTTGRLWRRVGAPGRGGRRRHVASGHRGTNARSRLARRRGRALLAEGKGTCACALRACRGQHGADGRLPRGGAQASPAPPRIRRRGRGPDGRRGRLRARVASPWVTMGGPPAMGDVGMTMGTPPAMGSVAVTGEAIPRVAPAETSTETVGQGIMAPPHSVQGGLRPAPSIGRPEHAAHGQAVALMRRPPRSWAHWSRLRTARGSAGRSRRAARMSGMP